MSVAFRLHRIECHICGQRADCWIDGITLPCGCGALSASDLAHARVQAEDLKAIDRQRRRRLRAMARAHLLELSV